jgi:hypothetical protein
MGVITQKARAPRAFQNQANGILFDSDTRMVFYPSSCLLMTSLRLQYKPSLAESQHGFLGSLGNPVLPFITQAIFLTFEFALLLVLIPARRLSAVQNHPSGLN